MDTEEDWTMSEEDPDLLIYSESEVPTPICVDSFMPHSQEEESLMEEKIEKAAQNLHEIFVEGCCALYNDIRNALDEIETVDNDVASIEDLHRQPPPLLCIVELEKRQATLMRQAEQLSEQVPQLADTIQLRLLTLGRSMEQLRIKQKESGQSRMDQLGQLIDYPVLVEATNSNNKRCQYSALPAQFRKWLQSSEQELEAIKEQVTGARTNPQLLYRLRANQQVLQLQIETEGRALHTSAHQQLLTQSRAVKKRDLPSEEKRLERWRCNLEALEHRWWAIWLASLENLELIEHSLHQLKQSNSEQDLEDDSELEQGEPVKKRRKTNSLSSTPKTARLRRNHAAGPTASNSSLKYRRSEKEETDDSDTIPFSASEYESITCFEPTSPELTKKQPVMETVPVNESEMSPKQSISPSSSSMDSSAALSQLSDVEQSIESGEKRQPHKDQQLGSVASQEELIISTAVIEKTATNEDGWSSNSNNSSRQLHDVGYSSGENSVYEALNRNPLSGSDPTLPAKACEKSGLSIANEGGTNRLPPHETVKIIRSYYKTVPLDDAGVTDTETSRRNCLPDILLSSTPADSNNNSNLTDSLIVQLDQPASSNAMDDFEEVMGIMDEQLFEEQLKLLRQGTQWRELKSNSSSKANNRRVSAALHGAPNGISSLFRRSMLENNADKILYDADASSEESDEQRQRVTSICDTSLNSSIVSSDSSATLQRKRRFRRVINNSLKLENIQMDQSVYMLGSSDLNTPNNLDVLNGKNFMSRSLNTSCSGTKAIIGRRKVLRRRMRRSASDNDNLCLGNSNSFQAYLQCQSENRRHFNVEQYPAINVLRRRENLRLWPPSPSKETGKGYALMNVSHYQRRDSNISVESSDSATSTTIQESGDAHYEWDEYKDSCDALMTPTIELELETPTPNSSNSSGNTDLNGNNNKELFSQSLIDEDFQSQLLPHCVHDHFSIDLVDVMLCESKKMLNSVNQQLRERNPGKMAHSQLCMLLVTNENLKQLSAIIRSGNQADGIDMDQITEVEKLRKKWSKVLAKISPHLPQPANATSHLNQEEQKGIQTTTDDGQIPSTSALNGESISLHTILEDMKAQLNLLKLNGSTCLSIDEIETVIATRRQILQTLLNYRDDLQQLAAEAQRQGLAKDAKVEAEIVDLLTLVDLVEKSLSSIESSTISLEKLRIGFECLCTSFKSLESKIEKLATEGDEIGERNENPLKSTNQLIFVRAIESELELCQERMNALETMCNMLSHQLRLGVRDGDENMAPHTPIKANEGTEEKKVFEKHDEFFMEFSRFREELSRLKSRFNNVVSIHIGFSNVSSKSTPTESLFNRKRRRTPPPSDSTAEAVVNEDVVNRTIGTQSDISAAAFLPSQWNGKTLKSSSSAKNGITSPPTGNGPIGLLHVPKSSRRLHPVVSEQEEVAPTMGTRLRTALKESRLAQLFLGCALLMSFGVLLLSWLVDDSHAINNWRWQFGPQLDYVRGPPPV